MSIGERSGQLTNEQCTNPAGDKGTFVGIGKGHLESCEVALDRGRGKGAGMRIEETLKTTGKE